ncbi:MAG: response regulator, partial [Oscillospiraceae bacterium]|nr:response regulator [Oscillospiraceae bacterium]
MKLLLVEDERALSRAVTVILKKNNYTVETAYAGVEALEYLAAGGYDGVVMDIMMPRT